MDMYLEMRPDGSVEERTQLRQWPSQVAMDTAVTGRVDVINVEKLSDEELLDWLRAALAEVVVYTDSAGRREAWQRVIEGIRSMERRYPPESEESA